MNGLMSVRRVAAAILPMDSITGRPVPPGNVKISIDDGGSCERKKEGYVIFWDNGRNERTVFLESSYFRPETVTLNIEEIRKKRLPCLNVWMKPTNDYPYPKGIQLREETAKPYEIIRIPIEESVGSVNLEGAYPMDTLYPEQISLRVDPAVEIDGRRLMIRTADRKHQEYFTIWEQRNRSMGLYILKEPLQEIYSVYDAQILLVMEFMADEKGLYQIPVFI